jgi:Phage tail assembly chaperone proteins, E, or 41 or 14
MKTIIVKLDDAIVVDGKEITELELRKPTVLELQRAKKAASGDPFEQTVVMIRDLASLPPEGVSALSVMDFIKIQEALETANFTPAAPKLPNS